MSFIAIYFSFVYHDLFSSFFSLLCVFNRVIVDLILILFLIVSNFHLLMLLFQVFMGVHMTQIQKNDSISQYDTKFLMTYCTYPITWFEEWMCTNRKIDNVDLIS